MGFLKGASSNKARSALQRLPVLEGQAETSAHLSARENSLMLVATARL
jgi:hypothetical protein